MKNYLYLFLLLVACYDAAGQTRASGPEQDCINVLPLCGNTFTQTQTYTGSGSNTDELPPGSCLTRGETNSIWYTFEIATDGDLNFLINPLGNDDYDFGLYDITTNGCTGIHTTLSPELRCGYASSVGIPTGLGPSGTATGSMPNNDPILKSLTVQTGQKFALLVSNFSSTTTGYSIDFSASTCSLGYTVNQSLFNTFTQTINKGEHHLTLRLNRYISCNDIDSTGADFIISNPGWHISHVKSAVPCTPSGFTTSVDITFDSINPTDTIFDVILKPSAFTLFCGSTNTLIDTAHVNVVIPPLVAAFGYYQFGDSILVSDHSTGADSIYYYFEGSHDTYTGANISFPTPGVGNYILCQVITDHITYDTICINVYITGINDLGQQGTIAILPNPTDGFIKITLPVHNVPAVVMLYNVLGEQVIAKAYTTNESETTLDLSQLTAGTYVLRLKQGDQQYIRKVVKY